MATVTSSAVIPTTKSTHALESDGRDHHSSISNVALHHQTNAEKSSRRSRRAGHSHSLHSSHSKDSPDPPPSSNGSHPKSADNITDSNGSNTTNPIAKRSQSGHSTKDSKKSNDGALPVIGDHLSDSVISMNSSTMTTKQSSGTVYLDISGQFPYFDDQHDLKQPLDTITDQSTGNKLTDKVPNKSNGDSNGHSHGDGHTEVTTKSEGTNAVTKSEVVSSTSNTSNHQTVDTEQDSAASPSTSAPSPAPTSDIMIDSKDPNDQNDSNLMHDDVDDEDEDSSLSEDELEKLEHRTLTRNGYIRTTFIARTLQGEVFNGKMAMHRLASCDSASSSSGSTASSDEVEGRRVVIKKTSKKLHSQGITITKTGKRIKVQENIVAEADLLQLFHSQSPPSSLIEFIDFFQDSKHYYLVMEHGGSDYFDFIVKCHELILKGQLTLSEWRKHCKFMFAQMVQFIRWMHEVMHCANLDISLENMLISDLAHFDPESKTLKKCYIKFIDFGLTEFFDLKANPHFLCTKYVGKTHYKAPKVYGKKKQFCANEADIWSLGVCLFMMIIGAPPYNKPIDKDVTFQYVKYKQIAKLLQEWGRIKYVTSNLHDLLTRMMCVDEEKRITMQEIVRHPWIRHYFPADNLPTKQPVVSNENVSRNANHNGGSGSAHPHAHGHGHHGHSAQQHGPQKRHSHHPQHQYQRYGAAPISAISIPQSPSSNPLDGAASPHYQPTSPSCTPRGSISGSGPAAALNIMIPQMAVPSASGSVMTPSPSRQSRGASMSRNSLTATAFAYPQNAQIAHRYSSPYSPYSPVSPTAYSPHHGTTAPPSQPNPSPITPIMQSRTSKHDQAVYYASIDGHDRRDSRNKPRTRRAKSENALSILSDTQAAQLPAESKSENAKGAKRKKSKKFFSKISLPIFGGH